METRDILNKDNMKIGELTLPLNTPEEVWEEKLSKYREEGMPVIVDVTPRQIRQALILHGVSLTDIENALALLPEPTRSLAQIEWEYSVMFLRRNPLVEQVGQMLGWTSEQLDDLWIFAAKL